jgi:hypothetical protein
MQQMTRQHVEIVIRRPTAQCSTVRRPRASRIDLLDTVAALAAICVFWGVLLFLAATTLA